MMSHYFPYIFPTFSYIFLHVPTFSYIFLHFPAFSYNFLHPNLHTADPPAGLPWLPWRPGHLWSDCAVPQRRRWDGLPTLRRHRGIAAPGSDTKDASPVFFGYDMFDMVSL